MVREIKFRAKRIDNDRIVYGQYFQTPLTDENSRTLPEAGWFFLSGEPRHCIAQEGVSFVIDVKTLGQFTGIKDKNGKEIYEGDIVKYTFRDGGRFNSRYMEIVYRDAGFKMQEIYRDYWLEKVDGKLILKHGYLIDYKGEISNLHSSNLVYWTETIGNTYEDPELLSSSQS